MLASRVSLGGRGSEGYIIYMSCDEGIEVADKLEGGRRLALVGQARGNVEAV